MLMTLAMGKVADGDYNDGEWGNHEIVRMKGATDGQGYNERQVRRGFWANEK